MQTHPTREGRGREMESSAAFLPSCPLLMGRGREVVYGLPQAASALLTLVRRNNKASLQPCFVAVLLYFSSKSHGDAAEPFPIIGLVSVLISRRLLHRRDNYFTHHGVKCSS